MLLAIAGTAAVIGTLAFRFRTGTAGYAFAMPVAWPLKLLEKQVAGARTLVLVTHDEQLAARAAGAMN
jgi:predicted ABC-type transport system involved in lysophospholipase L1 biosynthesis ATPase subunit